MPKPRQKRKIVWPHKISKGQVRLKKARPKAKKQPGIREQYAKFLKSEMLRISPKISPRVLNERVRDRISVMGDGQIKAILEERKKQKPTGEPWFG